DVGAFSYPNGVPQSEIQGTGEQWDFPNGWSPSNHMLIEGLRKSESPEMQDQAFQIAKKWVYGNYGVFHATKHMWEKYDVSGTVPVPGKGGEYQVQDGFGWTNGVILDLLLTYYDRLAWVDDQKPGGAGGASNTNTTSTLPTNPTNPPNSTASTNAPLQSTTNVPVALGCTGSMCNDPVPQCPTAEWHYLPTTDRCYVSMFPNHVWKDANDFCYLLFGNLPIVANAFANNAVLGLALNYSMTPWVPYTSIGLHDPGKNGTWVWTDGQKFTYSNWETKPKPDDGHCAFMCTNA
ncbi:Trehalase protein 5, partial [Aphelenchoides avenae]